MGDTYHLERNNVDGRDDGILGLIRRVGQYLDALPITTLKFNPSQFLLYCLGTRRTWRYTEIVLFRQIVKLLIAIELNL